MVAVKGVKCHLIIRCVQPLHSVGPNGTQGYEHEQRAHDRNALFLTGPTLLNKYSTLWKYP
jgi:hypothetical protein